MRLQVVDELREGGRARHRGALDVPVIARGRGRGRVVRRGGGEAEGVHELFPDASDVVEVETHAVGVVAEHARQGGVVHADDLEPRGKALLGRVARVFGPVKSKRGGCERCVDGGDGTERVGAMLTRRREVRHM